ncbi:hypothetical protein AXK61_17795 [Tsukamurella pseudospumae]|uniref:DUF559 domain-containing protein n=2 Tax=Tsukamurella pseudospumae TaxID=239498 RepID=A0A137ZLS5_9ACTN|nr:hypothetical protein [Tsukamurella pseudospumae]KXO99129.1 hypothetical protein AXK61_17795 [Tsukamurella pseudospumae]
MGMGAFEREVHRSAELIADVGRYAAEKDYRCITPGFRVPRGETGGTVGDLATAMIREYPGSALCGWTAARLHLHTMAKSRELVEVLGPKQIRRRGVISRTAEFTADDVVIRYGLPCTAPIRTAMDLMRYTRGDEGIAAADQCLRVFGRPATAHRPAWVARPAMATVEQIEAELDRREWWRGSRIREVLREADGRSQSPWETFSRLTLHRAGLTNMIPQVPVLDGEYFLDLADEVYKVAVEYDGAHHRDGKQHAADVERWNVLEKDLGWNLIIVTAGPLANRPEVLLRRVRRGLSEHDFTA